MIFYIDLRAKDGSNTQCFRIACYAFLRANGYEVIESGKSFSKVDTERKTAIDVQDSQGPPSVTEKMSWTVMRTLLK